MSDEELEPEVIDTVATGRRRPRWQSSAVVVTAVTLVVAVVATWLLSSSGSDGRSALDAGDAAATVTASTMSDATTDVPFSATTEAPFTTEGPSMADGDATSTSLSSVASWAPNQGFTRIIMDICDDQPFRDATCTNAIEQYCRQNPPPQFILPNLVGKDAIRGALLSDAQVMQIGEYEICNYGRYANPSASIEWVCNDDPSTWGIVFEHITPVGATGHSFATTGIRLRAWNQCAPPTTCVLLVEPTTPDPYYTPTSVLYCR